MRNVLAALAALFLALGFHVAARGADLAATPANIGSVVSSAACGDRVIAAAGDYVQKRFGSTMKDCSASQPVLVIPAAPLASAFVGNTGPALTLDNPRGLTFDGWVFKVPAAWAYNAGAVVLYDGKAVSFVNSTFSGTVRVDGARWASGVTSQRTQGLRFEKNTCRDVYMCLVAGQTSDLSVQFNDVIDFGTDGFNLGGIQKGLVRGNRISWAHTVAGAHADCLQVQQPGTSRASTDLTIDGNLCENALTGPYSQGFFGGPENGVRMARITFSNNLGLNTGYNGLAFSLTDDLVMDGNVMLYQQHADATWSSWIMAKSSTGRLVNNTAMSFILTGSTLDQAGNTTRAFATAAEVTAARAAWMAKWRGSTPPPEPVPCPPDPQVPILQAQVAALEKQLATTQEALAASEAAGVQKDARITKLTAGLELVVKDAQAALAVP